MCDAGYDVFIPNGRGNYYSRGHTRLTLIQSAFWNFSSFDIVFIDNSAILDYILELTKTPKLYVIGHLHGATAIPALLLEKPEYNEKIAAAALMAPVVYSNNSDNITQVFSENCETNSV